MTRCWKIRINLKDKHAIKWLMDFKYDSTRIAQVLKTMRQIILFSPGDSCAMQCILMLIFYLLLSWFIWKTQFIWKTELLPNQDSDFTDGYSYPQLFILITFKVPHVPGYRFFLWQAPHVLPHSIETPQISLAWEANPFLTPSGAFWGWQCDHHTDIWRMKAVSWLGSSCIYCLNHLLEGSPHRKSCAIIFSVCLVLDSHLQCTFEYYSWEVIWGAVSQTFLFKLYHFAWVRNDRYDSLSSLDVSLLTCCILLKQILDI